LLQKKASLLCGITLAVTNLRTYSVDLSPRYPHVIHRPTLSAYRKNATSKTIRDMPRPSLLNFLLKMCFLP
jgi:hypothetical protein